MRLARYAFCFLYSARRRSESSSTGLVAWAVGSSASSESSSLIGENRVPFEEVLVGWSQHQLVS